MRDKFLLLFLLFLSAFLLFYRLSKDMMFIGDFGWFYLSARDMLLTGHIPLVGINSSHPWLHQGPLWTYMLASALAISHFNPVSGGYLAAGIGVLTVFCVYYTGKEVFSRRTGFFAAFFYATSPLVIIFSRMPYHTMPIPLFSTLTFLALYKWVKGELLFSPVLLFFLAILYNFELATILLVFPIIGIFGYGLVMKKPFVQKLAKRKNILLSIVGFVIPLLPVLLYDVSHKFVQTAGFAAWIGYRIIRVPFGMFFPHHLSPQEQLPAFLQFLFTSNQRFLFLPSGMIALFFLLLTIFLFYKKIFCQLREKKERVGEILLSIMFGVGFLGFIFMHTVSEAYLPIFFCFVSFVIGVVVNDLMENRTFFMPTLVLFISIAIINIYSLLTQNYLMNTSSGYGVFFDRRFILAKEIVEQAHGRKYTIIGKGNGSQFKSFTMNTEYLTWWLGNAPVSGEKLRFIISETPTDIQIQQK